MMRWVLAILLLSAASPAFAEERDYCPTRPGLGTTPCTIAPKRVSVETALVDWTLDDQPDARSDTVLIGNTFVRVGLTNSIEAQIGWTPYGNVRTRDKNTQAIDTAGRAGDVTLGMKANLLNPDGSKLSIAVQPFATVPVGRAPVGAGDWGAGVVVPATYDLSETLNLASTSEIDAKVDEDGSGRHFAYSEVIGLEVKLSKTLSATIEGQVLRDEDPGGRTTQGLASASLAWSAQDDLQLDVGAVAGLNRAAPDVELYLGVSRRF
ncbi:transporter [Sphingomonas sp. HMP6]|uniref:transporter n=1 Tax=Sphingomonas sp. HMP6 TaxID=1517551 RepID=UPI001596C6BA|nr:transporter [Sphingomonas sp. HMP6]